MECPKCQAQMEPVRFEATEVYRCVRCGGLWFNARGEEAIRSYRIRGDRHGTHMAGPDAQPSAEGLLPC
jgi:Zn-finger nucleic acid-binding protein